MDTFLPFLLQSLKPRRLANYDTLRTHPLLLAPLAHCGRLDCNSINTYKERKLIMKSPLPYFTCFLQQRPKRESDAEYYETNADLAKMFGAKTIYENNYNFWDLVDKAPSELDGKKDKYGISLDILWAEEQIELAFEKA